MSSSPSSSVDELSDLHRDLSGPLMRYARSLGLSSSDSEDVVQDVFLALYRHLLSGRPNVNLKGWLITVTRNVALKRREREARALANPRVPEVSEGPTEAILMAEQIRAVKRVINALSPRDRQCLSLHISGQTYREVAAVVGVSLGTVSASLNRTRKKLQKIVSRKH